MTQTHIFLVSRTCDRSSNAHAFGSFSSFFYTPFPSSTPNPMSTAIFAESFNESEPQRNSARRHAVWPPGRTKTSYIVRRVCSCCDTTKWEAEAKTSEAAEVAQKQTALHQLCQDLVELNVHLTYTARHAPEPCRALWNFAMQRRGSRQNGIPRSRVPPSQHSCDCS